MPAATPQTHLRREDRPARPRRAPATERNTQLLGFPPRLAGAEPPPGRAARAVRPVAGRVSLRTWTRAVRVRQWTKNLLVLAVPAEAGALTRPGELAPVLLSFVVFCLLASGAYLINDVSDVAEDRRHPVKRHRPIASGAVPADRAVRVAIIAITLGLVLSLAGGWGLTAVACAYASLNVVYTRWLRAIAVADLVAIAVAFVLRAMAGGVAAKLTISPWLIMAVSFGALFIAAGKRYADFLDPVARRSRPVLRQYSAGLLRAVIALACAAGLIAYTWWAFAPVDAGTVPWRELTTIPFTTGLLRYGEIAAAGRGGAPEEILFRDRFMQLAGAAWLLMFALGG